MDVSQVQVSNGSQTGRVILLEIPQAPHLTTAFVVDECSAAGVTSYVEATMGKHNDLKDGA